MREIKDRGEAREDPAAMDLPTSPPMRPTIYLVEDDEAVRRALAFALDLDGFEVRTFACGEALLLSDPPPASGCLVLDQRLPGVSGLDTLRQLRARGAVLPAILVTSHPRPDLRAAAAGAGAPIVDKPLDSDALVRAIRRLLDHGAR